MYRCNTSQSALKSGRAKPYTGILSPTSEGGWGGGACPPCSVADPEFVGGAKWGAIYVITIGRGRAKLYTGILYPPILSKVGRGGGMPPCPLPLFSGGSRICLGGGAKGA